MPLQDAQEQLQNALIKTFLANLSFLKEYDNKLFQRVDALTQAINIGEFKENYELEFVQDNGDFDIYDIKNDKYLYNKNPNKFNKNAYHKTDFTSKGSLSILDIPLFQGNYFPQLFDEVEFFCNYEHANKKLVNDIYPYFSILQNNISDYRVKKYKYIEKFIFIGTLLGRHIPLILEKTNAKNLFICEKNLEIFRLSLFVVDYSNFARDGKSIIFSIMEDASIFSQQVTNFLSHNSYENYSIKYFSTDIDVSEYFDLILNNILSQKSTTFNHHMVLENMWKNTALRINKYKILQLKEQIKLDFLDTPILFVGAGPSLGDNLEWLKENKNKFLIVAIGATYKILEQHGIQANLVTSVDPQYSVLDQKHFDKTNVKKLKNTCVLSSINTDKRILDRFNQKKLFLFEIESPLHSKNLCFSGYSVGEISASIVISMGFKNIYLLGLDFAINQKTGDSHSFGYSSENYSSDFIEKKHKEDSNTFTLEEELIEIKGNLLPFVYTNRIFSLSLNAMANNISFSKKTDQKIYNLSNHGAFFENTIPQNINDLNVDSFSSLETLNLNKELEKNLNIISKKKLDKKDQNDMQNELKYLFDVENKIKEISLISSSKFFDFKEKIDILKEIIFSQNNYTPFVDKVFMGFFNVNLQYVYYCFNNQKFKNEDKKIKEIEKVFFQQLEVLLKRYISYLKKI